MSFQRADYGCLLAFPKDSIRLFGLGQKNIEINHWQSWHRHCRTQEGLRQRKAVQMESSVKRRDLIQPHLTRLHSGT